MSRETDENEETDRVVAEAMASLEAGLNLAGWADDEIEKAVKEHPEAENDLFHAFRLLRPSLVSGAWQVEFVFRGHARELLARIAKGEDTRPGTAAECCIAMSKVSQALPLHGAASGFYFRMWKLAFPKNVVADEATGHHEALYRDQIDDHERHVRRALSQAKRVLDPALVTCHGEHWGQPAECKYAREATS